LKSFREMTMVGTRSTAVADLQRFLVILDHSVIQYDQKAP
jgi:hypothetical protein